MFVFFRLLLLFLLLGAISLSPVAVGASGVLPFVPVVVILLVCAAYAFGPRRSQFSKKVLLVLLSACFAITLSDLAARPLLFYLLEVRPTERFIYRWPSVPQLQRYVAGVNFEGRTYGDLAAVSGRRDWREWRRIRFVTDEYGFRNEPLDAGMETQPLDVIVLGDSFGVAGGTSQEDILSSRLARDFGLRVYNLSVSRENPQQEYANLLLEGNRLNTREGACVLWLVFSGNDLDEPNYRELENPRLVRPRFISRLVNGLSDFRSRSPVRRLLSRDDSRLIVERRFIDGSPVLFHETYEKRRNRTTADVMQHRNFNSFKSTLAAMEKLAGERRLNVVVALVPSKEEVYSWTLDGARPWSTRVDPSGFSTVLRSLCEQHQFRVLDLKPGLVEASRYDYEETGALLWWRDDSHWNGHGQRAAALAVYENLLRDLLKR